jgi:hypothetical protein
MLRSLQDDGWDSDETLAYGTPSTPNLLEMAAQILACENGKFSISWSNIKVFQVSVRYRRLLCFHSSLA